jgi:hypothetical protein
MLIKRKTTWHLWFAWHPVYVGNGKYAWLQRVWRMQGEQWWQHTIYELPAAGSAIP